MSILPTPLCDPVSGVLIVSPNGELRRELISRIKSERWRLMEAVSGAHALGQLESQDFQLLLLDPSLPDLNATEFHKLVRTQFPHLQILPLDRQTGLPVASTPRAPLGDELAGLFRLRAGRAAALFFNGTIEREHSELAVLVEARNELILSELSQVYYLARRIHERLPQHVPLEDLVHAGVLGLIEAARKYNPNKSASLKSFASFRIRGAILDSLRALDWGSRPLRKKGRNVAESITKLANKLGRQPAEDEIAADLDMEISELHTLLRRLDGLHIVGQMVGSRLDDSETQDLIENAPANEDDGPFEICLRSERSDYLTQAIKTLTEKEQMVVSLYYREELTMREVAAVMDLVESRVSQIHSLAITKLRAAIQEMQLKEDTFR